VAKSFSLEVTYITGHFMRRNDVNEIAIAEKCYRSMRKSETPQKSKLIVADKLETTASS
jgi:hypothetical protein